MDPTKSGIVDQCKPVESSGLSFEAQIKSKLRKGLNPTSTKLTSSDGSVSVLVNQGTDVASTHETKGYGFVVDTKPDLTIGKIKPWLFVSSQDVPNDVNLVIQSGIHRVLSLLPGFELNPVAKSSIESHMILDVFDECDYDLNSPTIATALSYIHDCKVANKNVLVHCNAGISRAPSIVILYLMRYEDLGYQEAFSIVKLARPFAKPNAGFVQQMKNSEKG